MKNLTIIQYLLCIAFAAFGLYLNDFLGGAIFGFFICLLILVIVGRWQAAKAAKILDNKIREQWNKVNQ